MNLTNRLHESEQLDNPDLQGEKLEETLRNLQTVNSLLGNVRSLSKSVVKIACSQKKENYRIVDLGCGGGDVLMHLAKVFRKRGIKATFTGIDFNAHSLQYAKKNAADFPEIQWLQADVLSSNFELPECDFLISSHFMYHFEDAQLIAFLQKHQSKVHTAIIISELQRSSIAYFLFQLFAPLLQFSRIAYEDGLVAIRRAFNRAELEGIMQGAGIERYELRWKWAFRYELVVFKDG